MIRENKNPKNLKKLGTLHTRKPAPRRNFLITVQYYVHYPIPFSTRSDLAGHGKRNYSDLVALSIGAVLRPSPPRRIVLSSPGQAAKMQGTLLAKKDHPDPPLPPIQ